MWIRDKITKHLMLLTSMHLDFSPTDPDVIVGTQEVWIEAFRDELGLAIENVDSPRIDAAFKKARKTIRKWPAPIQVIELMPRRPERDKLGYDPPADAETAMRAFKICQDVISGKITVEQANAMFEPDADDDNIEF